MHMNFMHFYRVVLCWMFRNCLHSLINKKEARTKSSVKLVKQSDIFWAQILIYNLIRFFIHCSWMFFFLQNVRIFINQSVIKSNPWVGHIHAVYNCWSIETTIFINIRYCLSKTLFYRNIYKISIIVCRRIQIAYFS